MSIYEMQLDTAVSKKRSSQTVCSFHPPYPHTLEQHETQTSFSGSHAIWSKKNPCSYHKRLFSTLSIGFIGSISPMFKLKFVAVHENLWKIWVEMDALRNGPLFGNSLLCSAGNARRLSIISTGNLLCCARLRGCGQTASVITKINAVLRLLLRFSLIRETTKILPTWIFIIPRWWRRSSLSGPSSSRK